MVRWMVMLGTLIGACAAWGQTRTANFVVHGDQFAGPAFVGFGANMNPFLFTQPNWGKVNDQNVADLERKIIALSPQHVRIFFLNSWGTNPQDRSRYESFVRTVSIAQKAGASVNLTLWSDPDHWDAPDRLGAEFARNVGRLIRDEHVTAMLYITIQNEPDTHGRRRAGKITLPKYAEAYRAFDRTIRQLGLRDRVKIIPGDLVQDLQKQWVEYLGPNLADVADGYSIHVYWNYWEPKKLVRRLNETVRDFDQLPVAQRKPLYVTEFGTRGRAGKRLKPGLYDNGRPIGMVPISTVENAWFMLKGVNQGFVAFAQWDMYDAYYYRTRMHYGLIGPVDGNWPLKPGYFLMKLLTHTCHPGWRAVKVEGKNDGVTAAAMKSLDGQATIWAVNHSAGETAAIFQGLPPDREYHLIYWNYDGAGELCDAGEVRANARGVVSVPMPFQSAMAVTTLPVSLTN